MRRHSDLLRLQLLRKNIGLVVIDVGRGVCYVMQHMYARVAEMTQIAHMHVENHAKQRR